LCDEGGREGGREGGKEGKRAWERGQGLLYHNLEELSDHPFLSPSLLPPLSYVVLTRGDSSHCCDGGKKRRRKW